MTAKHEHEPVHRQDSTDTPALSIDLHAGDACWATMTCEQGRLTLTVARHPDGKPWRITRDELGDSLIAARRLLGA